MLSQIHIIKKPDSIFSPLLFDCFLKVLFRSNAGGVTIPRPRVSVLKLVELENGSTSSCVTFAGRKE